MMPPRQPNGSAASSPRAPARALRLTPVVQPGEGNVRLAADHRPPEAEAVRARDRSRRTSRGLGRTRRPSTRRACNHRDEPSISSPPIPVRNEPPRAAVEQRHVEVRVATARAGRGARARRSPPGRRSRARPGRSTRSQSVRPRCATTCSCHSDSADPPRSGNRSVAGIGGGQALAPGHQRRDGEHRGRVTAAREADDARAALQRRQQRALDAPSRGVDEARRDTMPAPCAEHEPGRDLERGEPLVSGQRGLAGDPHQLFERRCELRRPRRRPTRAP